MDFEKPAATSKMNNAIAAAGDGDGEAWDAIGAPLDEGVDRTIPAYADVFMLDLRPKPGDKRLEICDVRWGKIAKDAGRLNGLAGAMDEIARVIRKGKDQLAHDWKGESFESFKLAIDTVEKTLTEHAKAARTTATGLTEAMTATSSLYTSYRDMAKGILSFQGIPKPDEFVKVDEAKCAELDWGYIPDRAGPARDKIRGLAITKSREKWFWHESGLFEVDGDAQTIRDESIRIKTSLEGKINEWYVATDGVRTGVTDLYDAALHNLRLMAELKIFEGMRVPGAPAPGETGGTETGGGGGGGGGNQTGGGGGGGGGSSMPPPAQMPPQPDLSSLQPEVPVTPGLEEQTPSAPGTDTAPETVTIEDGDNKISVQSPDGQGHVKVTVDDGSGQPKSYDLDFSTGTDPLGAPVPAADPEGRPSSTGFGPEGPAEPGAEPGSDAEVVKAGPDGKCVISEPPLTITAERPAGQPDTVLVTVDDGTGKPTTYTLDYSEPTDQSGTGQASTGQPGAAQAGVGQPGASVLGGDQPVAKGDGTARPQTGGDPGFGGSHPVQGEMPQQPVAERMDTAAGSSGVTPQGTAEPMQVTTAASAGGFSDAAGSGLARGAESTEGDQAPAAGTTPGEAGLSTASDHAGQSGSGGQPSNGMASSGMAGSGMGGGMMGGGGGGGQGGDTERAVGQWRTAGNLFDDDYQVAESRAGAALGDDGPNPFRQG